MCRWLVVVAMVARNTHCQRGDVNVGSGVRRLWLARGGLGRCNASMHFPVLQDTLCCRPCKILFDGGVASELGGSVCRSLLSGRLMDCGRGGVKDRYHCHSVLAQFLDGLLRESCAHGQCVRGVCERTERRFPSQTVTVAKRQLQPAELPGACPCVSGIASEWFDQQYGLLGEGLR